MNYKIINLSVSYTQILKINIGRSFDENKGKFIETVVDNMSIPGEEGWYICHNTRPRDRRFIHKYYHIIHSVLYHIFRTFLYFGMIYSQKYNLFYYHILNGKPYRICMTCSLNINVHNYGIVYPHKRTEIIQDHALENFGV